MRFVRSMRFAGTGALLALAVCQGRAAPIQVALTNIDVRARALGQERFLVSSIDEIKQMATRADTSPISGSIASSAAIGEGALGFRPAAKSAAASVSGRGTVPAGSPAAGDPTAGVSTDAFAWTFLSYATIIETTALPPHLGIEFLPVNVDVHIDARATATPRTVENIPGARHVAGASAYAEVTIRGDLVAATFVDAPAGCESCETSGEEDAYSEVWQAFVAPGQPLGIGLLAWARSAATADRLGNVEASAAALADPVFSFNQAAFDEYAREQGFQTFALADYYRFEFSPGILASSPSDAVPEPSTAALLALGGLILASVRRLSMRSRKCTTRAKLRDGDHGLG